MIASKVEFDPIVAQPESKGYFAESTRLPPYNKACLFKKSNRCKVLIKFSD